MTAPPEIPHHHRQGRAQQSRPQQSRPQQSRPQQSRPQQSWPKRCRPQQSWPKRGRPERGTPSERARPGERGSASVLTLVVAVALVVGIALAVDGSRKAQSASTATATAEEAARAGGQALQDRELAEGDDATLDTQIAIDEAHTYLTSTDGAEGTARVEGNEIIVDTTVTQPTLLLGVIGIESFTTHGTGTADLISL